MQLPRSTALVLAVLNGNTTHLELAGFQPRKTLRESILQVLHSAIPKHSTSSAAPYTEPSHPPLSETSKTQVFLKRKSKPFTNVKSDLSPFAGSRSRDRINLFSFSDPGVVAKCNKVIPIVVERVTATILVYRTRGTTQRAPTELYCQRIQ